MFGLIFKFGLGTLMWYRLGPFKLFLLLVLFVTIVSLGVVYSDNKKKIDNNQINPIKLTPDALTSLEKQTQEYFIATSVMGVITGLISLYYCKIIMDTPKAIVKEIGSKSKKAAVGVATVYRDVGNFFTDPIVKLYQGSVHEQKDGSWINTRGGGRIVIEAVD